MTVTGTRSGPADAHDNGGDADAATDADAEFGGIVATSGGYYGVTPDHNPFLGYDRKVENLIRLVGFSGHGAMFGPFTARVALALAESGRDVPTMDLDGEEVELDAFRIGRAYAAHEAICPCPPVMKTAIVLLLNRLDNLQVHRENANLLTTTTK